MYKVIVHSLRVEIDKYCLVRSTYLNMSTDLSYL